MDSFPEDIFTEPTDVDPDTMANLGPLRRLAGEWRSAGGVDVNPKADGPERRRYIEHALFGPIDAQANEPGAVRELFDEKRAAMLLDRLPRLELVREVTRPAG